MHACVYSGLYTSIYISTPPSVHPSINESQALTPPNMPITTASFPPPLLNLLQALWMIPVFLLAFVVSLGLNDGVAEAGA